MRVLVINDSPLEMLGDNYFAVDPWIQFPMALSSSCEAVTLWAPVAIGGADSRPATGSWKVDPGAMRIAHHDNYATFVQFYRLWPRRVRRWSRQARELMAGHDIVLLRQPSPMLPLVARAANVTGTPLVVFLAADIEKQSDRVEGRRGLKRAAYRLLVKLLVRQEQRWCGDAALVYAYSEELGDRHGAGPATVRLVRTPHLKLKDFAQREDSYSGGQVRVLRLCWLLPSKGLETLLEAVALLSERSMDIRLEIVGKERVPGYQAQLESLAGELAVDDRVTFPGWRPYDQIKGVCLRNNVQVISSLAEGTPRVIVEGAATGLPLVCTEVGGCVDVLENEKDALLVPPRDALAIADAVERIIADGELRRRLISNGYEMAKECTFETLGMRIVGELEEIVAGVDQGESRASDRF